MKILANIKSDSSINWCYKLHKFDDGYRWVFISANFNPAALNLIKCEKDAEWRSISPDSYSTYFTFPFVEEDLNED